jgi:DeoR family glycerol-3-phosphate regulon repressor
LALSYRHRQILLAARQLGRVTVDSLADKFDVTPQTIRRDLNDLCDQGLLSRVHGGAVLESGVANVSYNERRSIAAAEKDQIGRLCAAEIPDNASLFINIGTTTEAVARALLRHRDLLVITNSINVANILVQNNPLRGDRGGRHAAANGWRPCGGLRGHRRLGHRRGRVASRL